MIPSMDPSAHFDVQRQWYERYRQVILEEAEPITAESVFVVELLLMEAEVDAAKEALASLGTPAFDPGEPFFVRQEGTTCMSTSAANGMISLGEPYLQADPVERVTHLTSDIVARTSAMGKPGEYRSVDDMFKYLESGRLLELGDEGEGFSGNYAVRLTSSLIDVCEALWTGRGRLVIQRSAHAHLGYGLEELESGEFVARFRDPMMRSGPGYRHVTLEALRRDFLWSPLKKIPRLMGPHGFPQLGAEELVGHLKRYDEMQNMGVDCPSALLFRESEAPALFATPEDEGSS
jgi:hypothetical protein